MLAVQVLRIAVASMLLAAAVTDALSMPVLYVAAFLIGAGEAFFDTNAQAILPAVVGRERLVSANGRLFAVETITNTFIGPPLGGLLVAVAIPAALASVAVGFALAAMGLVLMSGSFRAEGSGPRQSLEREIGEGIVYLFRHRLLLALSLMVAAGRLGSAGFFALFALYAVGPVGLDDVGFGILFVTLGAGSLVGSVTVGRSVARLGRPGVLFASTIVFAIGIFIPALTTNVVLIGAGLFATGVAVMSWNVTNVSLRQSILPSRLMGRVHATHRVLATLAGLTGAVAAGAVGEVLGLRAVFAMGAAVVLLGLLARVVVSEERILAAEAAAAGDH